MPKAYLHIRGVDQYAYRVLRMGGRLSKAKSIVSSDYVTVKFFPANHYISLARKSAVAYGYFNNSLPILNEPALEKALVSYNGKYKKNVFFNLRNNPLSTAVGRARFKKLVKRHLFDAVARYQTDDVMGFYFFIFRKMPVTEEERLKLRESILRGVDDVANNKTLRAQLEQLTKVQNRENAYGRDLIKNVRLYNYIGEQRLPRYVPKLPFVDDPVLR